MKIYRNKIMEKYNEFNMQVREGLIKTYPIKTAIKLISRELSILEIKHAIDMEESTNTIFVKMLSSNIDKNLLLNIMRSITLCGYFIYNYDFYNSNGDNIDYLIHKDDISEGFLEELFSKINNSHYAQIKVKYEIHHKI